MNHVVKKKVVDWKFLALLEELDTQQADPGYFQWVNRVMNRV